MSSLSKTDTRSANPAVSELRPKSVREVEQRLKQATSPRLHMATIVCITGCFGFLTSFAMLKTGVTTMAIRYPVAVLGAYGLFIGIVRLWLLRYRLRERRRADTGDDVEIHVAEVPWIDVLDPTVPEPGAPSFGGGGGFSGGGSSRAFGTAASEGRGAAPGSSDGSGEGGGGFDLDGEGALVLIVLLAVAALASGVLLYVVFTAPTLFAELLLDVALATGLYRRLGAMP